MEILGFIFVAISVYKLLDYLLRIPTLGNLSGRFIFITGCDTGFGNLAAKLLDSKGCHVIAACLTEKGETELRKFCSSRLKTVALDVANHESVTKAYEAVKALLPPGKGLWGLVNNAAIMASFSPFEWFKIEDYMKVLSVNLLGMIDVTTTFLPLVKKERGRIINTSSNAGRLALPILIPYVISKWGVEAFSDGIRRQLRGSGVTVHIITPGAHNTMLPFITDEKQKDIRKVWESARDEVKQLSQEEFDKYLKQAKATMDSYPLGDPVNVAKAYERALLSYFPRARYLVRYDAPLFAFIHLLPEWISDVIAVHLFKDLQCPQK